MPSDFDFLAKLVGLSNLLEQHSTLEQGLRDLAAMTASLLGVENCSIMLLGEDDESQSPALRVYTHHGQLPAAAYQESVRFNEGVAGRVVASGKPLLVENVFDSEFAASARRDHEFNPSLISAPIWLGDRVIGVINVNHPTNGRRFDQADLKQLEVFALFVGKSIHVAQLQNLLDSRLLQHAVVLEAQSRGVQPSTPISPDPSRLAKIVARTFYRELTRAGFGPNDIISAATEVIALLSQNIEKHKRRVVRQEPREQA